MTKNYTFSLSPEVLEMIEVIAFFDERSKSSVVSKAIKSRYLYYAKLYGFDPDNPFKNNSFKSKSDVEKDIENGLKILREMRAKRESSLRENNNE